GGSSDAAWAPDGATFAFATHDGTIQVFDGETRFLVQTIPGPGGRLAGLDYAPDGQRIAAYSEDEVVGVWDRATGEAVWTAPVATQVFGIEFSADGALLAVGHRGGVGLYDAATGALLQTLQTPEEVSDVAFSPDGQYLAASALVA